MKAESPQKTATGCIHHASRRLVEPNVFGFNVISDEAIVQLRAGIASIPRGEEVRRKRNVYGVRNLLEICPARETSSSVVWPIAETTTTQS